MKEEQKEKYLEVEKKLNKMLEEEIKQNPTKTISSLRQEVLINAKKNKIIKDFRYTTYMNTKFGYTYFGSCAGFDSMYKIYL